MEEFIKQILSAVTSFKEKANALLSTLPPLEQAEAASELSYPLRWITNFCKECVETANAFDSKVAEWNQKASTLIEERASALLQEKLSSGDYIPKADAQEAANQAANTREGTVRQEIATVAQRRIELTTPAKAGDKPVIPAELASHLSNELLLADDYRERAGKVATRLGEIASLGMNLPTLAAEACSLALDDAGENIFKNRLSTVKEVAEHAGAKPPKGSPFAAPSNTGDRPVSSI